MNHATKMILVPHEMAPASSKGADTVLLGLDEEMKRIVLDQTLPIDAKIIEYNQILQRYQRTQKEKTKPFQLEVKDVSSEQPPTPPSVSKSLPSAAIPSADTSDDLLSSLLSIVPERAKKNAALLLSYVRKNPNIKISDSNEIIINNHKIEGANIIDLIKDLTKQNRTKADPPEGLGVFLKSLVNTNIPRELIINKKRLDLLKESALYATPGKLDYTTGSSSSNTESPAATPSRTTPKKPSFSWGLFRQAVPSTSQI